MTECQPEAEEGEDLALAWGQGVRRVFAHGLATENATGETLPGVRGAIDECCPFPPPPDSFAKVCGRCRQAASRSE
jgi:hypothetical protein